MPLSLAASSTTLNRKFSERNWPNSALPLPIIEAGSRGVPSGATPSNRPSLKPPPLQRLEEPKSRALKRTLRFLNRLRCISATLTSSITCWLPPTVSRLITSSDLVGVASAASALP
ncbi:hypothetical protein D3C80_1552230 [compost metagenome]